MSRITQPHLQLSFPDQIVEKNLMVLLKSMIFDIQKYSKIHTELNE
jgi:hypothetical protein